MREDRRGLCCKAAQGDSFTIAGAAPSYAPDLALEPTHIEVRLAFDLDAQRAEGSVTQTVRCNRPGARRLLLDAVALDVASVDAEGGVQWRHDGTQIDIAFATPLGQGEERKVTIRYSVTRPITGMRFSAPDAAYPDRPRFVDTDHETERARYWLPCIDYPTVRTSFDFHLTAPRDLTILANGLLRGERENGDGTKTAHWRLDHPCPSYLCCLAIGRFIRHDDEPVGGRAIAYFATERFAPHHLARTFGKTPAMMRWLEDRIGVPFPFPKYFQIALPGIGGAMENISLVTWDDAILLDEDLQGEWGHVADAINIHEMAHSYFGDALVCRHFEHSWLKESWAVYVETVWLEETEGMDAMHFDLFTNARRYFEEADRRYARPIVTRTYNSSWDLFDAHLYPGGAWRIHMLRHLVGDDAFWAATRDYVASYSGRLVETDDFRRKLEEHGGINLVRFFDQWIHGKGYPKLKATLKQDAEKGEATLVVEQTQADEKKGIGLFAFPLNVRWEDDAGVHLRTLHLEEARHAALLKVAGKVKTVRLDPDAKVLFALEFNPGDDLLRRSLREDAMIGGRIWAAEELIRTGTRANLAAVGEAMRAEPFWGVRGAVAEALLESRSAEAVEPIVSMLDGERDPRAKRLVAKACGGWRDPRLRDALLRFLERPQPPLASAAALAALGMQREEADFDLLAAASVQPGFQRLAASGALRGLGALRTERALALLKERLPYGREPAESRPVAVEAYASGASRSDRDARQAARELLADLTRDPCDRTRLRAAAGLAELGDAASIPALESMKPLHAAQDRPRIDRLVARLQKGAAGEEVQKLREQVEKLEERQRKQEQRLQDLEARK